MKQFLTEWRKYLLENKAPKLLDVPDIRQFNEYSCGSACLLAVLAFYDLYDKNEKELTKELNTNSEDGTSLKAIKRVAENHSLNCDIKKECDLQELKSSLSNGNPVILNFQAWSNDKKPNWKNDWKDGHYAVLVGMDEENLYMRDPSIYNKVGTLSIDEFMDRWHDVGNDKNKMYNVAIFFSGKEESEQEFEKIK
jgi:predicted double-glycine peptidase